MAAQMMVTVRGARHRHALDLVLKRRLAKLERMFKAIQSCRIVVATEQREGMPKRFDVKMVCSVDKVKNDVVVESKDQAHLSIAVTDAFARLHARLSEKSKRLKPGYWRHKRQRSSE